METTTATTKTIDQHICEIDDLKVKNDETYSNHLDTLLRIKNFKAQKLNLLKEKLPLIIEALTIAGLSLNELFYYDGSMKTKLEYVEKYENVESFRIGFNVRPFNGKTKLLKYDIQDKNRRKLKEKARKLEDEMKQITGIKSVRVNESSLEKNPNGTEGVIIYEAWL